MYDLHGDKDESCVSLHQAIIKNIEKRMLGDDLQAIPSEPLAEHEQFLLAKPSDQIKEKAKHRPIVAWLRRTEYISSESTKISKSEGAERLSSLILLFLD